MPPSILVSGIQFIKDCFAGIVTVSNIILKSYTSNSSVVVDNFNIAHMTGNSMTSTDLSATTVNVSDTLTSDTLRIYPYTSTDSSLTVESTKVGINLPSSPTVALEVIGNMKVFSDNDTSVFLVRNPTNFASRIYVDPETGNVGLGSSSPSAKLYVNGNMSVTSVLYNQGLRCVFAPNSNITVNSGAFYANSYESDGNCAVGTMLLQKNDGNWFFWSDKGTKKIGLGVNNTASTEVLSVIGNVIYTGELKLPTTTFVTPSSTEAIGYTIKQVVTTVDKLTSPSATFVLATLSIPTGIWFVIPKLDIRGLGASITFTQLVITYKLDGTEILKWSTYKPIVPAVSAAPNPQDSLPLEHFTVTNTTTTAKSLTMDIYSEFTGGGSPNGWRINAVTNQCYLQATRIS